MADDRRFVGSKPSRHEPAAVFYGAHLRRESAAILSPRPFSSRRKMPDVPCRHGCLRGPSGASVIPRPQWWPMSTLRRSQGAQRLLLHSANAVKLVKTFPDRNASSRPKFRRLYARQVPEKTHLWPGYCVTHHQVNPEEVEIVNNYTRGLSFDSSRVPSEVTAMVDFIGSTSQIIKFVKSSTSQKFIIGTEWGLFTDFKEKPVKLFTY